jgi:phospholipid N-methyltransferase
MSSSELQRSHTTDDLGHFFKSWLRNPLAMGAFAPSGRSLAKLMANAVGPGSRVLELGAGTGTVTAALLATGMRPEDLHVVESNPGLVKILERRFPRSSVLAADALALEDSFGGEPRFDFVISGLPLLLFSPEQRLRVLDQAFALLGPAGRLHQFTYGGRCPIDRDLRSALRIESTLLGIAALNLPPAFVYRLTRAVG